MITADTLLNLAGGFVAASIVWAWGALHYSSTFESVFGLKVKEVTDIRFDLFLTGLRSKVSSPMPFNPTRLELTELARLGARAEHETVAIDEATTALQRSAAMGAASGLTFALLLVVVAYQSASALETYTLMSVAVALGSAAAYSLSTFFGTKKAIHKHRRELGLS